MLVLSRKKNEVIHFGDNIQIVVVEVRGDKVRLGIDAPKSVPVHRGEVYEAIKRQGQNAKKKAETEAAINAETADRIVRLHNCIAERTGGAKVSSFLEINETMRMNLFRDVQAVLGSLEI